MQSAHEGPHEAGGVVSVAAAVQRDLVALADDELAGSALAATALELGRMIDDPENSATSKANCAGKLLELMRELRSLAPEEQEDDRLDDLSARRDERRTA